MDKDELLAIEKGFWFEGADYYEQHISAQAVFVFPGMRLNKEDGVAAAAKAKPRVELEMEDSQLIGVDEHVAILTYHARSRREGQEPYSGHITTVYRLEGGSPKMIFHQHTPDAR